MFKIIKNTYQQYKINKQMSKNIDQRMNKDINTKMVQMNQLMMKADHIVHLKTTQKMNRMLNRYN